MTLSPHLDLYRRPREAGKKSRMMDLFKIKKGGSEGGSRRSHTRISKYEQLSDVCDFIDQKLGGFLNFTKDSLERCEELSKRAYVDSNLYTLLVFWMSKFMEFFATVIFEAINFKIESAIRQGKGKRDDSSGQAKPKFDWNLFKKKPKKDADIRVSAFLSPDTVELFRSVFMLIFRFNAKNQRFMEKIRASNYFSECDQIRTKFFDLLRGKASHLVSSISNEVARKVAARVAHADFAKTEKHPRVVEQFLLHFGKFYREVAQLANADLIRSLKLSLFVSVHASVQHAFLRLTKPLFSKVRFDRQIQLEVEQMDLERLWLISPELHALRRAQEAQTNSRLLLEVLLRRKQRPKELVVLDEFPFTDKVRNDFISQLRTGFKINFK